MTVRKENVMYVIRYEDEIVGPFKSQADAGAWLDTLQADRARDAIIESLDDPDETKVQWEEWDAYDNQEARAAELRKLEAAVTLAAEPGGK